MRTVWFVKDDPVWTWDQSWGLSRDERSGRWTLYDHRASEEDVGTKRDRFQTTSELAADLLGGEYGWDAEELMDLIEPFTEPAMLELLNEVRRRAE